MRAIAAIAIAVLIVAVLACVRGKPAAPAATEAPSPPPAAAVAPVVAASPVPVTVGTDAFAETIKPLLARTCAPCHVPGGRMYERLPFDDAATVRTNRAGILRRLKPPDKDVVEAWLASQTGS